jgi:hypothetical protein
MNASMLEIMDVYAVAGEASATRVCVEDAQVRAFSHSVSRLLRQLGDDAVDEYWAPVVRRLRRVRWELATTPLPHNHAALRMSESSAFVERSLRACDRIYPAHAASARSICEQLEALATTASDPLGGAIIELLRHAATEHGDDAHPTMLERRLAAVAAPPSRPFETTTVVVLRHARYATAVEDGLAAAGFPVSVLTASQLAQPNVYGRAVVVGASVWYPAFVLAAPRALRIDVVQYGWIRDDVPEISILAGSEQRVAPLPSLQPLADTETGGGHPEADPSDLLPPTDWSAISAKSAPRDLGLTGRAEQVQAYLLLLASDEAVYLEAEEGSRAYVVALGAEKELRQVPTRSIEPGTYLVTREGGEGDYIPAIADSLLGRQAPDLRAAQRRWTSLLQEVVHIIGLRDVVRCLKDEGSVRATEMNARRWASDASIRTQDFQDFDAIMRVIGLEAESEDLWNQMALIDQAHLRAGQRVRALLEREILKADTRELERRGWMDYDVAEIEGEGALRVARVAARAPDTVLVPAKATRQPFPVERDLWQG